MAKRISTFVVMCFVLVATVFAQEHHDGNLAERQKAPTVLGGTGLFNTFSTRTLCKGEFNFALFWNNYDRDPGDIDINQVPFNISLGLTNRWELWVNWITWQNTTSRQPFLLSGYQLSASRFYGDPLTLLGPAVGGKNGAAAFFPGSGAIFGGILPALGRFGTPDNLPNSIFSPGGPGGTPARGLGPLLKTDLPSFYPELPFFGEIDFVGFDSLGRPVFGPRESSNGSGDVTIGTKFSLMDANRHWFSMALGGYLKIPVSSSDSARARGRTSGEYEFGPILMFGQESSGKRLRFYENVGYIHTTDPSDNDVKLLDLPDKLLLNGGVSVALNSHAEFVTEILHTHFIGSDTPSLIENNPTDLNIGARFFFKNGAISFGGAYRRFLNNADDITLPALRAGLILIPPFFVPGPPFTFRDQNFTSGGANGFVGYLSIGGRRRCPTPPAPTCVLTPSATTVNRGERLTLTTTPTTPGYAQEKVTYEYRWEIKDAQGRTVTVSGSGATVEVPTHGIACGRYSATTIVIASVQAVDCPGDCTTTGQTSCTTSFEITDQPCPTVSCQITASPSGTIKAGDQVTLTATSTGADNPTYAWSTTGGKLSTSTGASVILDTTGVTEGARIIVSVEVSTSRTSCDQPCQGNKCSVEIPLCPTINCHITRLPEGKIKEGTKVTLRATSTGIDNPTYTWSAPKAHLSATTGSSVELDTTGVEPGTWILVTVDVTASRAGSKTECPDSQCFVRIPIEAERSCKDLPEFDLYVPGINNIHKQCLMDTKTRMDNFDKETTIVIDGHRSSKEKGDISYIRALYASIFLIFHEKVDGARIQIRDFGDTCPNTSGNPKKDARIEVWLLPNSSDLSLIEKVCGDGATPEFEKKEIPAVGELKKAKLYKRTIRGVKKLKKSKSKQHVQRKQKK
jgi:hypothetical protein